MRTVSYAVGDGNKHKASLGPPPAGYLKSVVLFSGYSRLPESRLELRLILASGSPRRAEILRNAGFDFEVCPSDVDETVAPKEAADAYVSRLARAKATVVAERASLSGQRAIVIAADTTVVMDGRLLGKPLDKDQARQMLQLLSGKTHEVLTAVCLCRIPDRQKVEFVETTRVTFRDLSENQIEDYVRTDEPFDKAGGYGIQRIGGKFVRRIEGCYFTVMGLPLSRLSEAIEALESLRRK